jgi:hypothetical protein
MTKKDNLTDVLGRILAAAVPAAFLAGAAAHADPVIFADPAYDAQ